MNVRYLRRYPLALCLRADEGLLTENARKLALWCVWSYGQRVSWDDLEHDFEDLMPEYVAEQVLVAGRL